MDIRFKYWSRRSICVEESSNQMDRLVQYLNFTSTVKIPTEGFGASLRVLGVLQSRQCPVSEGDVTEV